METQGRELQLAHNSINFRGRNYIYLLFSRKILSDSLRPHGLQHARLLCPQLFPRVCSNSHPLNQRCYLTISSSTAPFAFNPAYYQCLFQWVCSSHQVAKVLELSSSISPFKEYVGLISFTIDWYDLLAMQGMPKSLLQQHNLKASILHCSTFFRYNSQLHT